MNLSKITAGALMAGSITSAALGIGAGIAQAGPDGPNVPNPNIPGPNVPGGDRDVPGPGQHVPGQPICNPGAPGVNCNEPGSPFPPGQNGFPPPGHYNDPVRYGLPATWVPPVGDPDGTQLPVVFNPQLGQWGVNTTTGFQVFTPAGGTSGSGQVSGGVNPGT